jgi:general secretion pathway protein G
MSTTTTIGTTARRRDRIAHTLLAWYPACLVLTLVFAAYEPLLFSSTRWSLPPHPRERVATDIARLCKAIDEYTILNGGRAPESLDILVSQDVNGRALLSDPAVLVDPWNRPYGYEMPTSNPSYRVFTLGHDGQLGGEGEDADIDNFTIAYQHTR